MELIIIIAVVVILAIMLIATYNKIISKFNKVKRSWSDIQNYENQKIKILEALADSVSGYVSHESSTFKEITALRQSIISMNGSEPDPEALADVQKKTNEVIKGLSITLENYPDLKANTVFLNQMNEIKEQNENVGAAIAIYNRNTETFNTYIESFPINGANALLARKKRIVEYSNLVAAENIGYKPNF